MFSDIDLLSQYNNDFIGNIVLSEDDICSIKNKARILISNYIQGIDISPKHYEFLFVAFVVAIRDWSKESNSSIYSYLCEYFLGVDNEYTKIHKLITTIIEELIKKRKIEPIGNFTKKYYAILLYHALSPKYTFYSLFDLCWRLYFDELEEYYIKGDSLFLRFAEVLADKFSKDNTEKDTSINLGSGIYSFLIGLKGLAVFKKEIMAKVFDSIIFAIDCFFHNESVAEKTYLHQMLNEWWNEKKKDIGRYNKRATRQRAVSDIKQFRPKFFIENNRCFLFIPSIILPNGINDNPDLLIYNNDNLICSGSLDLRNTNLLSITEEFIFDVSDLQNLNINVVIKNYNNILYDSKKVLIRDYLLFSDDQEIQKNSLGYGNYILYLPKNNRIENLPDNTSYEGNGIHLLSIEKDEVIEINGKTIFFNKEENVKDFWINAKINDKVKYLENGSEYTVVDGDVYLAVKSSIDYGKYGIRYLETNDILKLSDFPYIKEGEFLKFEISLLTELAKPQSLMIFSFSDNKVVKILNFIKFENLLVNYDRPFYFDEINKGVVVLSSKTQYQEVNFCIDDKEVLLPIGDGYLVSNPPIITWKIDNEDAVRNNVIERSMWFEEYTNSTLLKINSPENCKVSVSIDNVSINTNSNGDFKIGEHLYYLKSSQNMGFCNIFLIAEKDEKKEIFKLFTVCFKEKITECPLSVQKDTFKLIWYLHNGYIGYKKPSFQIKIYNENKEFIKEFSPKGLSLEIFDLGELDGIYKFEVYSISKVGLLKKDYNLLYTKKEILGNQVIDKYRKKELKVVSALLEGDADTTKCRNFYIQICDFQNQHIDNISFNGAIYFKNYQTRKFVEVRYLSNELIAPINIKYISNYLYEIQYNYDYSINKGKYIKIDENGALCLNSENSKTAVLFCIEGFENDEASIKYIKEKIGLYREKNIKPIKRAPKVIKITEQQLDNYKKSKNEAKKQEVKCLIPLELRKK